MASTTSPHHSRTLSYAARAALPSCSPLNAYLLNLMTIKRTNLCVSADVTTSSELLAIAEELGDAICLLKTHADIINDFTDRTYHQLRKIASRKHFLIFEDRKFADIGSTVQKQYTAGPSAIAKWAELITVHVLPGPAIVTALKQAAALTITAYNTTVQTEISAAPNQEYDEYAEDEDMEADNDSDANTSRPYVGRSLSRESDVSMSGSGTGEGRRGSTKEARKQSIVSVSTTISTFSEPMSPHPSKSYVPLSATDSTAPSQADALARLGPVPFLRSCLLLAQMSSAGNLLTPEYTNNCLQIGRQNRDFVLGFISQESLNVTPEDNFLTLTPGVKLLSANERAGDDLGQQYNSPASVVAKGTDIIIVGRGIIGADDRVAAAERYRQAAWSAYETRIR